MLLLQVVLRAIRTELTIGKERIGRVALTSILGALT